MNKILFITSLFYLETSLSICAHATAAQSALQTGPQLPESSSNELSLEPPLSPAGPLAVETPLKTEAQPQIQAKMDQEKAATALEVGKKPVLTVEKESELSPALIDAQPTLEVSPPDLAAPTPDLDFPQLTTGHLDVLKSIKEQGGYKKKQIATINDIEREKLEATPTFRYIIYNLNIKNKENMQPDQIVAIAVESVLKTLKDTAEKIKLKNPAYTEGDRLISDMQNNSQEVIESTTDLTIKAIRKEVEMVVDGGYEVLYHAHLPTLRLYYDMLSGIVSYFKIQKLDYLKVLRDKKLINEFLSVPDYLQNFNRQFEGYSASKELPVLSDADPKLLGFSSGPDHFLWSKTNVISANLSLLGNRFKLGENTFYYFLNAFSHIDNLDFLFESLLRKILVGKSDEEIKLRVQQYLDLFQKYMDRGGGNLLQIFIKSDYVKKVTYFSWPYGIPTWLDSTKHLAVKGSADLPLPMLWIPDDNFIYETDKRQFMLPDPVLDLKLYRTNPQAFIEKFAPNNTVIDAKTKSKIYDRQQVRLLINMLLISDPNIVTIQTYTRYQIPKVLEEKYLIALNKMIKEDINFFLKTFEGNNESNLGLLQKYIKQGEAYKQEASK